MGALHRPLRQAGPRVVALLTGMTLSPRQQAVVLEALRAGHSRDFRPGAVLCDLIRQAFLAEGGVELLEAVLRGDLRASLHRFEARTWAGVAAGWQEHCAEPRAACALLLTAATREGWLWRRLSDRFEQDLTARALTMASGLQASSADLPAAVRVVLREVAVQP
jgi:hypothetical protein